VCSFFLMNFQKTITVNYFGWVLSYMDSSLSLIVSELVAMFKCHCINIIITNSDYFYD